MSKITPEAAVELTSGYDVQRCVNSQRELLKERKKIRNPFAISDLIPACN